MRAAPVLCFVLLATTLGASDSVQAHMFAPAFLEVQELGDNRLAVRWKQPAVGQRRGVLEPILPAGCHLQAPESKLEGTGFVSEWLADCPTGLVGETLEVRGLAASGADVLVRVTLEDGRTLRHILKPEAPSFVIPERQSKSAVARDYVALGVEHILGGWDHLLFVLGLVLLVGWGKRLLWTVTAFTVGHSVTLILAVLGVLDVPQASIEALIALSIYFLGVELVGKQSGRVTIMERMPWLVAGGFGLLHGLGFAGTLSEVGLPQEEIPLALFSFNVGIELGQLAFVGVVLLVSMLLRRMPVRWPKWTARAPAYVIGSLGAFWFFARVSGLITPI